MTNCPTEAEKQLPFFGLRHPPGWVQDLAAKVLRDEAHRMILSRNRIGYRERPGGLPKMPEPGTGQPRPKRLREWKPTPEPVIDYFGYPKVHDNSPERVALFMDAFRRRPSTINEIGKTLDLPMCGVRMTVYALARAGLLKRRVLEDRMPDGSSVVFEVAV